MLVCRQARIASRGKATTPQVRLAFQQGAHRRNSHGQKPGSSRFAGTRTMAALEDVVTMKDDRLDTSDRPDSDTAVYPAELDAEKFTEHWSVEFWKNFSSREALKDVLDEASPVSDRLRAFQETVTKALSSSSVLQSTEAAQYWAYHALRSGFFSVQAILGLSYARSAANRDSRSTDVLTRMEAIARNGWQGPLAEACMSYYQDYENIKEGRYTLPWDMVTTSHRQFNPLYIARKAAAFVTEATDTLRRREEGRVEDVWIKGFNIPDYFQNTFHYQTDGWMSSRSAQVYEASTETLFVGRQDAMQRTTLLLLSDYMRGKDASQIKGLEVACGTGRFATFVKDNYPTLDLTVTDLSPFYLQEARNNLKYWKRKRSPLLSLSGVDGNGVSFIQTPAEDLDIPSESMDVVYSVYLFHELPAESQEKAAAEMARVLKPGGMVVLTDSVQLGDRPSMDATLGNFGDFNEPFYRDYIERDLGALFESVGLVCDSKALNSTTKSLSFIKPSAEEDSNLPSEE
ncbi:hypothetical protein M9435_000357 [Picochlorum sp. BPE23]|nr:hypothetical protein M9435_000357 [Picochlorum sp. BPE23]